MTFTAPMPANAPHPVGTGPFLLKSWAADRGFELSATPHIIPEFYPTEGQVN